MKKKEIKERQKFLDVYSEFDKWLTGIGFRTGHYWKESATPYDCHYSHYNEIIDSLYSVEHFILDALNLSIRFLRDRNVHKFIIVAGGTIIGGFHSEVISLEEMKTVIIKSITELKNKKLKELETINI